MDRREQQSGDESEVIDEEPELHRVVRELVGPVKRESEEQHVGAATAAVSEKNRPVRKPTPSATSKKAATQARNNG
jgi:hypothetical protein